MMAQPTKFNDMASGAVNSKPDARSLEEINRLVNMRSLSGSDSSELLNRRIHPIEKPVETPKLPFK
jgi:hypothetical protein